MRSKLYEYIYIYQYGSGSICHIKLVHRCSQRGQRSLKFLRSAASSSNDWCPKDASILWKWVTSSEWRTRSQESCKSDVRISYKHCLLSSVIERHGGNSSLLSVLSTEAPDTPRRTRAWPINQERPRKIDVGIYIYTSIYVYRCLYVHMYIYVYIDI